MQLDILFYFCDGSFKISYNPGQILLLIYTFNSIAQLANM